MATTRSSRRLLSSGEWPGCQPRIEVFGELEGGQGTPSPSCYVEVMAATFVMVLFVLPEGLTQVWRRAGQWVWLPKVPTSVWTVSPAPAAVG